MSIDFRINDGIIIFDEGGCRSASQAEIALWARVAELESQMEFVEKVADDNEDALRRRIAELERELAYQKKRAHEAMTFMGWAGEKDFRHEWPEKMPERWKPE